MFIVLRGTTFICTPTEAKPAEANPCVRRNLARDFENPFKDQSSGKDSVEILSEMWGGVHRLFGSPKGVTVRDGSRRPIHKTILKQA